MSDKARSMWERFITAPENAALLKRYAKSAKEPAPLFDSIGEDLGSTNEGVRTDAFWALVAAMPELTNILYEWETRAPGWRDRKGKDQQMISRGVDVLSNLHHVLVKEHRFKIGDGYGKDPRPLLKTIIDRKKKDRRRKRDREEPLDYEAALNIPDPAGSPEDSVLENRAFEERKRELRELRFLKSEKEQDLFVTVHVDESRFDEVRKRFGIPSELALRKRLSRTNKNIVAVRDAVFSQLLIIEGECEFVTTGKLPRSQSARYRERYEEWGERAKRSVLPGTWLNGRAADGKKAWGVRALTIGFDDAPAHIYLLAVHKDYWGALYYEIWPQGNPLEAAFEAALQDHRQRRLASASSKGESQPLNDDEDDNIAAEQPRQAAREMIDSITMGLHRNHLLSCKLRPRAYPTELPGLNEALAEVLDAYTVWLMSNSFFLKSDVSWL